MRRYKERGLGREAGQGLNPSPAFYYDLRETRNSLVLNVLICKRANDTRLET